MTDWRDEIIRERVKRKRRQKEQAEAMTANPQTPPECSEPARTEPAGEVVAPTETAHAQAIAAVVEVVTNAPVSHPSSHKARQRIAAALAPFLVIDRDTAREIERLFDEAGVSLPTHLYTMFRTFTGSASRPDAGEANPGNDKETVWVEVDGRVYDAQLIVYDESYTIWPVYRVRALATSGRGREGDGE